MSLPPALLARLQKRGIVNKREEPEEEVIAENYDIPLPVKTGTETAPEHSRRAVGPEGTHRSGAPGCPNKWNPYHICLDFCYDSWLDGTPENCLPDEYMRRRARMLRLYPLPEGWKEVYDPGCARHYYWCPKTDDVCWLSPRHPRAMIGEAGPNISRELKSRGENWNGLVPRPGTVARKRMLSEQSDDSESGSDDDDSEEDERKELSEREKLVRAKRKGIDPMDPAAYGDHVPVGGWGRGLETNKSANSGADTTASGALYQSRPLPTPGEVLRRNAGK
uniref:WW domain-containing protein n=1 Tax=Steinernema glaseri TaxID=37863 RepID=A0A1I8A7F9_9BILA